jgi:hypothetical protein
LAVTIGGGERVLDDERDPTLDRVKTLWDRGLEYPLVLGGKGTNEA